MTLCTNYIILQTIHIFSFVFSLFFFFTFLRPDGSVLVQGMVQRGAEGGGGEGGGRAQVGRGGHRLQAQRVEQALIIELM